MYVAIFLGIVAGWWLAQRHIDHLLIVYYHFRFRQPSKYLELYDLCDGESAFHMMQGQKNLPKNYAEFLLWHEKARPRAGKTFRKYWMAINKELIRDYSLFLIIPTVLLRGIWLYFLLPTMIIHLGYWLHRRLVKKNRLDFYAMVTHTLVVNEVITAKQSTELVP